MECCPSVFLPFFWPHSFLFTVPVRQLSQFWMLISLYSPHLIPYTHSIIQFPADHLPPLMSFPICCTTMLQLLLLPLSLQNSAPLWLWSWPHLFGYCPQHCFFPLPVCTPSHTPSGLSSGCFPPIHTFSL